MPSRGPIWAHRLLGSMVRHLAITSHLSSPPQGSAQALNPHAPAPSSYSALDISVIEPGDLAFLPSRPSFCSLDRVPRRSFDSASEKAVSSTHRWLLDCPPSDGIIVGVSFGPRRETYFVTCLVARTGRQSTPHSTAT